MAPLSSAVPDESLALVRSKTMPPSSTGNKKLKESTLKQNSTSNLRNTEMSDRLKMAKEEAEKAIKVNQLSFFYKSFYKSFSHTHTKFNYSIRKYSRLLDRMVL